MNISIKRLDETEKLFLPFFDEKSISNFPVAFSSREFIRRSASVVKVH